MLSSQMAIFMLLKLKLATSIFLGSVLLDAENIDEKNLGKFPNSDKHHTNSLISHEI